MQDMMLCGGSDAAIIPIGILFCILLLILFCLLVVSYTAINLISIQQSLIQAWEALWHAGHSHRGTLILPKLHALGTL